MLSVFLSCIAPVISIGFSIAAGPELQQCPCTAGMRTFPVPIRASCTLSSSLAFGAVFKSKKSFFGYRNLPGSVLPTIAQRSSGAQSFPDGFPVGPRDSWSDQGTVLGVAKDPAPPHQHHQQAKPCPSNRSSSAHLLS